MEPGSGVLADVDAGFAGGTEPIDILRDKTHQRSSTRPYLKSLQPGNALINRHISPATSYGLDSRRIGGDERNEFYGQCRRRRAGTKGLL